MRVLDVDLKFKKGSDTTTLVLGACKHFGNKGQSEECIDNFEQRVANTPHIDFGDIVEGIIPGDTRYGVDRSEATFINELGAAEDHIRRVKKTCVGMVYGNHEDAISRLMGDITGFIASRVGVQYLGQTAYLDVHCPKGDMTMFVAHGATNMGGRAGEPERINANRKVNLRNLLKPFEADLCAVAHFHRFICTPPIFEERLCLKDGTVKDRPCAVYPKWHVASPAMWRAYADHNDYAQGKLLRPTGIGWSEVDIQRDGTVVQIRRINERGDTVKAVTPEVVG